MNRKFNHCNNNKKKPGTKQTSHVIPPLELHKPDEITELEKRGELPEQKKEQGFILENCELNISSDFSALVEQFKEPQLSPSTKYKPDEKDMDFFSLTTESNTKNSVRKKSQFKSTEHPHQTTSATCSPFLLRDHTMENIKSRPASISSKKTQKLTKSNRKFSGKKQQLQKPKQTIKYIERSYDEMMRIPNIYERLAFYEKTLELCLQAESPVVGWIKSMSEKGVPQPLREGKDNYTLGIICI
jgi:hypothetical protein